MLATGIRIKRKAAYLYAAFLISGIQAALMTNTHNLMPFYLKAANKVSQTQQDYCLHF